MDDFGVGVVGWLLTPDDEAVTEEAGVDEEVEEVALLC